MAEFAKEARDRQARFRKHSPTISHCGRSPKDNKGKNHGHLLAHGFEHENLYPGLRGKNGALEFFEERRIPWHRTGSGDIRGKKGPTRNLASSQVACVNFLLPLCETPEALAAVARAIDDDVEGIEPICHEGRESLVEFEWTGLCHPLEKDAPQTRGVNVTSVDALIVAKTETGRRAYLMEWKYSEAYGESNEKGQGKSGETRRRRYGPLYRADYSSFNGSVPMDELLYEPFYQIMRLRLLADRMAARKELGVTDAKVVVVVPEGNTTYRNKITSPSLAQRFPDRGTVEVVKATLKEPERAFAMVTPEMLLDAVESKCGDSVPEWVAYHRERYG